MTNPVHRYDQLPPKTELYDLYRPPEADLMDTVAHLQLEVEALKFVQSGPSTATKALPVQSKPAAFTSTKVPKFSEVTSWDQYRQVFDAICSVKWVGRRYDCTATASWNVALLVPEAKRVMRAGLVGALTEHYRSPGRLADYRRQFEKMVRHEGENPSIFAIALETLAVKAFGDMGPNVRLGSYGTGSSPVTRTVP